MVHVFIKGSKKMYEYLLSYQEREQAMEYLEFKLERFNLADKEKLGTQRKLKELKDKQNDVFEVIDCLNPLHKEILILKYTQGHTLESIAIEKGYSYAHIRKEHPIAIKIIKAIDNYIKAREMKGVNLT